MEGSGALATTACASPATYTAVARSARRVGRSPCLLAMVASTATIAPAAAAVTKPIALVFASAPSARAAEIGYRSRAAYSAQKANSSNIARPFARARTEYSKIGMYPKTKRALSHSGNRACVTNTTMAAIAISTLATGSTAVEPNTK